MVVICPFQAPKQPPVPLHEKILADFDNRANNVCLEDGETGQKWTSAQVRQLSMSVAHALPKYGFKKGDVMGFYMENRPEFAPLLLGISALGGTLSGVNPLYVAEELGVVVPKFDPIMYLRLAAEHKASYLLMVPTIMVFLAKHPDVQKFDLSSVKRVAVGAAPTGKELIQTLLKRLPNLETVTQVVSIDDGLFRELGPMESGEIWGRSKGVMKGYINRPDATRETIDKDGWLHTGDIGYFDHFGHFYIIDRLKELIKYKGYQVAPAELEDLIIRHPAVQEVGVVGFPDPKEPDIGELPTAFVVVKAGNDKTRELAENIKKHVAEHTANYKHLRGGVIFRDSIPKGGTGKMLRRELKNLKIDSLSKL